MLLVVKLMVLLVAKLVVLLVKLMVVMVMLGDSGWGLLLLISGLLLMCFFSGSVALVLTIVKVFY